MQVSNQCMALVRDEVLVPTKDAPELAYIRLVTSNIQEDMYEDLCKCRLFSKII